MKKAIRISVKILNAVVIAVLIILLCYNLYVLVARVAYKQQLPKFFGVGTAVVVSGSMRPNINAGDFIIIKEQDSYSPNEVITFQDSNILNTHRIVRVEDGFYITQGDANTNIDDPVSPEKVQGKVMAVVPKLGFVIGFLQSPFGLFVIFAVGAAIIVLPGLIKKQGKKAVGE